MRDEDPGEPDNEKDDPVDDEEVAAVERGDADAGSRREEVERAAEREEEAAEG